MMWIIIHIRRRFPTGNPYLERDQLLRLCKFIVARRPYTDKKFLMDRVERTK